MGEWDWRVWLWIGAGLGVFTYVLAEWRNRRVTNFLGQSAALLDLEVGPATRMDGMLGDQRVTASAVRSNGRDGWLLVGDHVRIDIEVAGQMPRRIELRWRKPGTAMDPSAVLTGDALFDSTIALYGDEVEILAIFNPGNRRAALDLYVGAPFSLKAGRLTLLRSGLVDRPALMEIAVRRLVGWANLLDVDPALIPARLAQAATDDPEAEVRRRSRNALLTRFTGTPFAASIARDALDDDDPIIRLRAAMALGDEKLESIIQCVQSIRLAMSVRLMAFEYLVDHAPPTVVMPLASSLLHEPGEDVATALCETLWRVDHDAVPPILARLLGDVKQRSMSEPVAIAAAGALGRCGTVEEVPALTAVVEDRGSSSAVVKAARTAVARIQGRLGGAGAGQLAVAAAGLQTGAMALAGWDEATVDEAV